MNQFDQFELIIRESGSNIIELIFLPNLFQSRNYVKWLYITFSAGWIWKRKIYSKSFIFFVYLVRKENINKYCCEKSIGDSSLYFSKLFSIKNSMLHSLANIKINTTGFIFSISLCHSLWWKQLPLMNRFSSFEGTKKNRGLKSINDKCFVYGKSRRNERRRLLTDNLSTLVHEEFIRKKILVKDWYIKFSMCNKSVIRNFNGRAFRSSEKAKQSSCHLPNYC